MKKYNIEFTEQQLITLARGLEFYSRFLGGQWEIPDIMEFKEFENQGKSDEFWHIRDDVNDKLLKLKSKFTGLQLNEYYGIGSNKLSEDAKISYDIYRPIWEEFAKKDKTWSVYSSPGLTYSNEGRIKIITNESSG